MFLQRNTSLLTAKPQEQKGCRLLVVDHDLRTNRRGYCPREGVSLFEALNEQHETDDAQQNIRFVINEPAEASENARSNQGKNYKGGASLNAKVFIEDEENPREDQKLSNTHGMIAGNCIGKVTYQVELLEA